jgi:Flp pilus assembly protein TadD
VRLAQGCLAPRPQDRPGDAGAAARELAAYQAGVRERLRGAELEAARATARAASERKARRLTAGLAAAVLLLGMGAGGGTLWWTRQRAEQERQQAEQVQAVNGDLEQVADLLQAWKLAEAQTALVRAEGRVAGGGPADLLERVRQMREGLDLVDALDRVRLKAATIVEGKFDYASADREYARLFQERALAVEGEDPRAVADRFQGSAVRAQLVAALDDWAVVAPDRARRAWLLEVARLADPDPSWGDRFRDPAVREKPADLGQLAREANVAESSPALLAALGFLLVRTGADAVPLLRGAQERHPADFWLNFRLGDALSKAKREGEAVASYRVALAVRPGTSAVHNNLGATLKAQGRLDDAIREFRTVIALDPKHALGHSNLGVALADKGRLDEAIQECRKAIALDPEDATSHSNLGHALFLKGRLDEAIQECRKAIALDPKDAVAHSNLGHALFLKGRLDEAIQECRKAIALDPKYALGHNNLGLALRAQGRLDDAIGEYRQALVLDPKHATAHTNLGIALSYKGRLDEAIQAFHQATALDPKWAPAHTNLGSALATQGRLDDAIQAFHQAIALDPKHAQPHGALGLALVKQGRFAEAQAATRRCLDLLPENHPLRRAFTRQLRQCERLLELSAKLPALLQGEAKPTDAAERIAFAEICQYQQRYAAAARFYAEAFADQPRLTDDLRAWHRYSAACAAARALTGQGKDADQLDEKKRARLRRQALGWLQADLAAWTKVVEKAPPQSRPEVQRTLRHWQGDHNLAGLRDAAAVANLPADERQACRKLWADVDALLHRARGKE